MSAPDIFRFLPTSGDTRYLGALGFGRAPGIDYRRDITASVDRLGYDGMLIATGASCLEPWAFPCIGKGGAVLQGSQTGGAFDIRAGAAL